MKPQRDIPEEWGERMINLGFHHNGKPSARRLAESADVAVGAALRVIFRENYGDATVAALGKAMRDAEFVSSWVGTTAGQDYRPPVEARTLTARQRILVDELIRELAKGGQQDAQAPTEKTPDAPSGGDVSNLWSNIKAAQTRPEEPKGQGDSDLP